MSSSDKYYEKCSDHKRVKSEIVSSYLIPWVKIVGEHSKGLHYLDMFSGRAIFEDGSPATPLMILDEIEKALIEIPWILEKLRLSFYEGDAKNFDILNRVLRSNHTFDKLKNEPCIESKKINKEFISKISNQIEPGTFTFIDPFGYKDITLDLIDRVTKEWGCDCLFYLSISGLVRNFERIEQEENLRHFFGGDEFEALKKRIEGGKASGSRGEIILTGIEQILAEKRKYYTVKYCVEFDKNRKKSHYLMFLSKNKRGFGIMRDIMIARGIKDRYGLPQLLFSPKLDLEQNQLEFNLGIETGNLKYYSGRLLADFGGLRMQFPVLARECLNKGYLLQDAHIRIVLTQLEKKGKIKIKRLDKNGKIRSDNKITKYDIVYF